MENLYKIITANDIDSLQKLVDVELNNGWVPAGGLQIIQDVNDRRTPRILYSFYQAVYYPFGR